MITFISSTESSTLLNHAVPTVNCYCTVNPMELLSSSTNELISDVIHYFSTSMKTCFVSISHKHHLSDNDSIQIRLEDNSSKSVDEARENSLAKLLEIKNLEDNWNGNGASRFSENLIAFVREMIMKLSVQPAIFPTARDSIQLEYENDCGDYLEFEIFEEGRIKMFSFDHAGKSVSKDIGIDEMNQVVSDFYEQQV